MASLNKVFLMGNLTRDPELRRLPSGSAVTELGMALNRSYTGKDGEKRDEVTYVDVTVWDRQAETCCQYLKKGRPVHVDGYLKMDSWDDKATGEKQSKLKIQAERVQFLERPRWRRRRRPGRRDDDYSAPAPRESAPGDPPRPRRPSPGTPATAPRAAATTPGRRPATPTRRPPAPPVDNDSDDDDIPF